MHLGLLSKLDTDSLQVEKTNMAVAKSVVGRRFRLEYSGHRQERKGTRFLTEVRAGLATFFAMAYIISVNAQITAGKSVHLLSQAFINLLQQVEAHAFVNQQMASTIHTASTAPIPRSRHTRRASKRSPAISSQEQLPYQHSLASLWVCLQTCQ